MTQQMTADTKPGKIQLKIFKNNANYQIVIDMLTRHQWKDLQHMLHPYKKPCLLNIPVLLSSRKLVIV